MKRILIICTSNKDRSPALVEYLYFNNVFPDCEYRSAGINKYFCEKKGTHLIDMNDIEWADLIVFAEDVHLNVVKERFLGETQTPNGYTQNSGSIIFRHFGNNGEFEKHLKFVVLNCGEYTQGCIGEDYLTKAEVVLKGIIK